MFPLRLNEFMSINNVETFAGHFNVKTMLHQQHRRGAVVRFRRQGDGRDILESMKVTAVTRADTIELGKQGRPIDVMQAPIRLIATRWLYDRDTKTLFTLRPVHPHLARHARPGRGSSPRADDTST